MDNLPSSYRDSDLVDLIRALSDLTVRVSVKYVSNKRPETTPETNEPFPHFRDAPRDMLRTGTGWVCKVHKCLTDETCTYNEWQSSHKSKTYFAKIFIHTSNHVVYDDLEGNHTTCHLFFDRGGTPDICESVITLSGTSRVESDFKLEKSELTYLTYDLDLTDRLDKILKCYFSLLEKLIIKDYIARISSVPRSNFKPMLIVIVSHPHGCSKQISLGQCVSSDKVCNVYTRYTYTTATCPGSSGAQVFFVGKFLWWWWSDHVHSGNYSENGEQLNYSGLGL